MMKLFEERKVSQEKLDIERFFDGEMISMYSSVMDSVSMGKRDAQRVATVFGDSFTAKYQGTADEKDTKAGLEKTMKAFQLTKKAFPGMENIADFNPKTDSTYSLQSGRMSNSSTYQDQKGVEEEKMLKTLYGFNTTTELTKQNASRLMDADEVSASQLFEAFSSVNSFLRADKQDGGKIRAEGISAGFIKGIEPTSIPGHLYDTMSAIAKHMNEIKRTEDPLVRKSQAIQLASFAYQMTISEHVFGDGNGRSCRLFADTILQSFGLPPHTPTLALMSTGNTIGKPIDFNKGAKLFFESVKTSDTLLKMDNLSAEELKEVALQKLSEEHVCASVLSEISPKESIDMAVQLEGNKLSIADSLDSFISADHWYIKNSDEYKDVITQAKALKTCLKDEPINSKKSQDALDKLRTSIDAYENHCLSKPRNNATREARLNAAASLKVAVIQIKEASANLTTLETNGLLKNANSIKAECVKGPKAVENCEAKYVIARMVEKALTQPNPTLSTKDAEKLLSMDNTSVNQIVRDAEFARSFYDLAHTEKYNELDQAGKLEAAANLYIERKEIAMQQKDVPKQPQVQKTATNVKAF